MQKIYLFFFLLVLAACSSTTEPTPLNILFIISDDLTTTAVSSHTPSPCLTPNIDQLAAEGVNYSHAFCQYPVCGPSRASFMFGYYPHTTGSFGYKSGREKVGEDIESMAQFFKNRDYYTARVSKIFHMGVPIDIEKGSHGTDDSLSWSERYNSQALEWQAPGEAELVQGNPDGSIERQGGNVMTIVKADGGDELHADGKTADKVCQLLREHKNKPFFIAAGMVRPHVPFVAPKSYFDPYPFANIILPQKVSGDWDDIPEKGINYVTSQNAQMSIEQQQKAVAAYYASVSYMDAQVGKILQTLKEEGLEENTIVVFTSDHGFHLGEHDFWMKVSLKDESVRIPLIIKVPGKKVQVCHSLVELIDLYPTLVDLAGFEAPKHLQGVSLKSTLSSPDTTLRDYIFSTSLSGSALLIQDHEWAYIQYGEDASEGMELFDMKKDPKQFTNLAYQEEYAAILAKYQQKLQDKLDKISKNE